jgi:capsular exopolysaccharide synthesis family protein
MAQSGFSVVIIDADLRRPSQHKIFGVPNDRGLTTLLTHPDRAWRSVAIEVIPNLWCVPSGPLPPNPSDLLSSDRFRDLIEQTRQTVDIVLVDTPPVLAVSDPLVVATATDGVLLVSRAGHTRIESLERAGAAFPESVRRIGVVLNQQERGGEGYYYYGDYYGSDEHKSPTGGLSVGPRLSWSKKTPMDPAAPVAQSKR